MFVQDGVRGGFSPPFAPFLPEIEIPLNYFTLPANIGLDLFSLLATYHSLLSAARVNILVCMKDRHLLVILLIRVRSSICPCLWLSLKESTHKLNTFPNLLLLWSNKLPTVLLTFHL